MPFKADDVVNVRKLCVSLDAETLLLLKKLGAGNVSKGIRIMARERMETAGKQPVRSFDDGLQDELGRFDDEEPPLPPQKPQLRSQIGPKLRCR